MSHFGYAHKKAVEKEYTAENFIYICPICGCPLFYDSYGMQNPDGSEGRDVDSLPEDVAEVYDEIRDCISHGCYTAAIMLGRKLIMHISVDKVQAKPEDTFTRHIQHLKNAGYIPAKADKLFEFIKNIGNEQNHEIRLGDGEDADKMVRFIEVILLFIYEMPAAFEDQES